MMMDGLTPGCRYLVHLTNGCVMRSTLDNVIEDRQATPFVLIFKPELAGDGPVYVPWHAVTRYTKAC